MLGVVVMPLTTALFQARTPIGWCDIAPKRYLERRKMKAVEINFLRRTWSHLYVRIQLVALK